MGRVFVTELEGLRIYRCKHCRTHLAHSDQILSRTFQCRHGKAYLVSKVVNVTVGTNEPRKMTTGLHIAADISCICCGSIVGWRYETAFAKNQKYKEGKFVLERYQIRGPDGSLYWPGMEAAAGGSDVDDDDA